RKNGLETIKTKKGIVYDKGGDSIQVSWGHDSVHASDSGAELEEESEPRFHAIVSAFEMFARRHVLAKEVDLLVLGPGGEVQLDHQGIVSAEGSRALR